MCKSALQHLNAPTHTCARHTQNRAAGPLLYSSRRYQVTKHQNTNCFDSQHTHTQTHKRTHIHTQKSTNRSRISNPLRLVAVLTDNSMAVVVIIFFLLFSNNRIWRRLCLCTITLLLTCCIFCPKICWMHELLHALFALKFTHTNFEPMHVNSYMQLSTCRHVYYMYHMYVCAYACTSVYRITHRRIYVFVFFTLEDSHI